MPADVRDGLDRLLSGITGQVADDLYAKVVSIRARSWRRWRPTATAGDAADPNVYLIRQTALSYLPEAFSDVPAPAARLSPSDAPVADGRTPHDVLLDQLDLMDSRLAEVADDIARHDSDRLLANGRFLAEKFAVSSLRVPADAATVAVSGSRRSAVAERPWREPAEAADRARARPLSATRAARARPGIAGAAPAARPGPRVRVAPAQPRRPDRGDPPARRALAGRPRRPCAGPRRSRPRRLPAQPVDRRRRPRRRTPTSRRPRRRTTRPRRCSTRSAAT